MQNIFDLFAEGKDKGISFSLVGGLLKVEPRSLLSDELREQIKKHKGRIVEVLE